MEKLFEQIKLVKESLPGSIDLNKEGKWVKTAEHGTAEYYDNVDCVLSVFIDLSKDDPTVCLYYYGDDDEFHYFGEDLEGDFTKAQLIASFSEQFGWIEDFEYDDKSL